MKDTEKVLSDTQYQLILTQRSVARVALHLGIETLPENTLTVLQDSLTHYLERVGRVLGRNVENGGRSSDHVNVLDALRAVEDCGLRGVNIGMTTATADMAAAGVASGANANVVNSATGSGSSLTSVSLNGNDGWLGLAKFLYGPNFEEQLNNANASVKDANGSRHGHMMNGTGAGMHNHRNGQHYGQMQSSQFEDSTSGGWNAPLDDYDSLPNFPVHTIGTSAIIGIDGESNATTFSSGRETDAAISMQMNGKSPQGDNHTKAADATAKKPTDGSALAASSSRSISPVNNSSAVNADGSKQIKGNAKPPTSKRKRDEKESSSLRNDAKRAKSGDGSKATTTSNANADASRPDDDNAPSLPSYIPNYLPPFPPKHTYAESSSSSYAMPIHTPAHQSMPHTNDDPFRPEEVRSSLVQLGRQSYWGSMSTNEKKDSGVFVRVSTGAVDVEGIAAGQQKVVESVKPVARASNARISRILEGSMDAHS